MLPPFNRHTCSGKWTLQERWDRTEIEGSDINTAPITWRGIHPETTRRRELVQFITSSRQKAILQKRSSLEILYFLLNHHNRHSQAWDVFHGQSFPKLSSPYRQHHRRQLQQPGQSSQGDGSRGWWAYSGRAHQGRKETGQRQGHEYETAE